MAIMGLGGYVDVHDGHLPREHTEEKLQQLQQLGRFEPFLSDGDDIEFDPEKFRDWFVELHRMHRGHGQEDYEHNRSSPDNHSHGGGSSQYSSGSGRFPRNHPMHPPNYPNPMNMNAMNSMNRAQDPAPNMTNISNMNTMSNMGNLANRNVNNNNGGNTRYNFDDETTINSNIGLPPNTNISSVGVDDSINNDNTTTNAVDGGSNVGSAAVTDHISVDPQHLFAKNERAIPEDESITHNIDDVEGEDEVEEEEPEGSQAMDDNEAENKIDAATEETEDDSQAPSTAMLTVDWFCKMHKIIKFEIRSHSKTAISSVHRECVVVLADCDWTSFFVKKWLSRCPFAMTLCCSRSLTLCGPSNVDIAGWLPPIFFVLYPFFLCNLDTTDSVLF